MECEERERLLAALDDALRAYSVAVTEISERLATTPIDRYQELLKDDKATVARLRCHQAWLALDYHDANHGC